MKRNLILIAVLLIGIANYGQKKKAAPAAKGTPSIAKVDNLVAEVKDGKFQLSITDKGKTTDVIAIMDVDSKFAPVEGKLSSFTANGAKLYLLTWKEKTTTKTDLKTENIETIHSIVYDIPSKTSVFSNFQTTNNIVEKVFLDKLKNASETQEKVRREGFVFTLNPDGSIVQKSKNQENKWVYDAAAVKYVDAKKKK
jgi:hypothetical protein